MNFEEYKSQARLNKKLKPGQDILERWETRIVSGGLQEMGPAGGELYLTRYGKSIASPKCCKFARLAEERGFPYFAEWFWLKAYGIDYPDGDVHETSQNEQGTILEQPTSSDTPIIEIEITPSHREALDHLNAVAHQNPFPPSMQPGSLVTSQPTDAQMPREFYINDDRYFSQPKRDGNKLICFATPEKVWYQSRQLKVNGAPSIEMDRAFRTVAGLLRPFIIEGEIYYVDVNGKEHMTGETCRAANEMAGCTKIFPFVYFSSFGCLYQNEQVLTKKSDQVRHAEYIMDELIDASPREFSKLPTAKTQTDKEDLARTQKDEGREGEVYFLKDLVMRPGKITSRKDPQFDGYVRCKYYLGVQRYQVKEVFPPKADGHYISGFSVVVDGVISKVGTGYNREQQKEILARWKTGVPLYVLVDAQTITQYGALRHAAFKGFADE